MPYTPTPDSSAGIAIHHVDSEFQNGMQQIHVLSPDNYHCLDSDMNVLYVLPVDKSGGSKSGYPLDVLYEMDAHNRYGMLIVFMTVQEEPWFADHPADRKIWQASYMHDFVVPFIDRNYRTVNKANGRFLMGFSKGGWGAYSMIFSRPDIYGFAAAWDAPFLADQLIYEMNAVLGDAAQLALYRPDLAVQRLEREFRDRRRLVLAGENYFGKLVPPAVGTSHILEMHRMLHEAGIQHSYIEDIGCPHTFNCGWMDPVLSALMELATEG